MPDSSTTSLLIEYYEAFLNEQNLDAFRQRVASRYTEGTLGRVVGSGSPQARRAAALALGLVGTMKMNETLAQALRDQDAVVRGLAQNALWAIWFRADSAENNATLEQVRDLINQDKLVEADALATKLIARAPTFAEAYNQRAIALFLLGRFAESVRDCKQSLERNPCHIGALSGLGQGYLRMGDRRHALETFRRALKLQPHSEALRETVAALEAADT